jgi:hypothetical protein
MAKALRNSTRRPQPDPAPTVCLLCALNGGAHRLRALDVKVPTLISSASAWRQTGWLLRIDHHRGRGAERQQRLAVKVCTTSLVMQ